MPPEVMAAAQGIWASLRRGRLPTADDLEAAKSPLALAATFESVVGAVMRPTVPAPSWFAQARRNAEARQAFLDEIGALTSEQVAALAGSRAANRRATAHRWQAERKLFAVTHQGQTLFPAFQFDPETGRPKPTVAEVLAVLAPAMVGWALALWWVTPIDLLAWARPVDRLDTAPTEVVEAAHAEAAGWAEAEPA